MAVAEGDTSQKETRGYEAVSAPGSTARAACVALSGAGPAVLPPGCHSHHQPSSWQVGWCSGVPPWELSSFPQGPCTALSLAKQLDSAGVQP